GLAPPPAGGVEEAARAARDAVEAREIGGGDQLGRRRRRLRAEVRREVAQREVDLVADSGDDGYPARRDGARHALLVERPKVLQAAAAAGKRDHVEGGVFIR